LSEEALLLYSGKGFDWRVKVLNDGVPASVREKIERSIGSIRATKWRLLSGGLKTGCHGG
jgi:hypothetical protein